MNSRIIAACVTGALLSSGLLSAVAARTPERVDDVATHDVAALAEQLHQLETTVAVLRGRVASLETELAAGSTPAVEQTVTAPFTVVNGAGTPIFTVSDRAYADASVKGTRVVAVDSYVRRDGGVASKCKGFVSDVSAS